MVTIREVAQQAGVSPTTVSHVLNESRFVSPAAARRVRRAMQDLHYQPNAVARSLRRKHSHTLGLIVPDSSNPFFAELARGVEDYAFTRGYNVIFGSSDGDLKKEMAYLRVLLENQVEGLILIVAGESSRNMQALRGVSLPLVILDREFKGVHADYVTSDNRRGGFLATEHLIQLGHRAIGCLRGPAPIVSSTQRLLGYRDALKAYGIPYRSALVAEGDYTATGGFEASRAFLHDKAQPPTALFALNDMMAIGCVAAAQKAGLRVPDDLSVIGFDDIQLASFTAPPLSTVRQDKHEIGSLAARLIIDRAEAEPRAQPRVGWHTVPVELVRRESTGPGPEARAPSLGRINTDVTES